MAETRRPVGETISIDAARRRTRRPQVALDDVAEPSERPHPGDPVLGELLRKLIATLPERVVSGYPVN